MVRKYSGDTQAEVAATTESVPDPPTARIPAPTVGMNGATAVIATCSTPGIARMRSMTCNMTSRDASGAYPDDAGLIANVVTLSASKPTSTARRLRTVPTSSSMTTRSDSESAS